MSSFLSLLRTPKLSNNILQDSMRKRNALSFRKTLGVYNYKVKPSNYYKNPHAIDLRTLENLKKNGDDGVRKIRQIENMSLKPFGKFSSTGNFKIDYAKIPKINIPNYENSVVNYFYFLL
jgi:large subunit ribosomal protein L41